MQVEPTELLDNSIAQLQSLAAFFADEIGSCEPRAVAANPETRICKEALLTISVLLPKLQVARFLIADARRARANGSA
jgi:hypothetical protein